MRRGVSRGMNHKPHTLGVPPEAKLWRRICRTGCIFDTWDVLLSSGSNIEVDASKISKSAWKRVTSPRVQGSIAPGVGRAGVGESCCCWCWAPQWQNTVSTAPKNIWALCQCKVMTHARSRQPHAEVADITDPSPSRLLITWTLMGLIYGVGIGAGLTHALDPPRQEDRFTGSKRTDINKNQGCSS